ncbi:MAG: hypothetical protein NTY19_29630 [Planctomycetota bacterium]|nr:hypothetical protein [Planctomycetota bacterium]
MSDSVLDATEDMLKFAAGKITYLGPQDKPIATVVFSSDGSSLPLERFKEIHGSGDCYINDELPYTRLFRVKAAELKRMLSAVKPILLNLDAAAKSEFVSFSLIYEVKGKFRGQEFRLPHASGRRFYEAIIGSLDADDKEGRTILQKQFKNVFPE